MKWGGGGGPALSEEVSTRQSKKLISGHDMTDEISRCDINTVCHCTNVFIEIHVFLTAKC